MTAVMPKVLQIFTSPTSGAVMRSVDSVFAIGGAGLSGDRYSLGDGSWNRRNPGVRQVSLISSESFVETGILPIESRRNIVVEGYELPRLIGKHFLIGSVPVLGMKYCYVCDRPSQLSGNYGRDGLGFKKLFWERGGILVNVLDDGMIGAGSELVI